MAFRHYKGLNLSKINKEILGIWDRENTFSKSLKLRKNSPPFVFYEGPPSANGTPGIHHVMARTIKDIFCRYKTLTNYFVERKGGWDTHGLPVELEVEKKLGITKEDIGKKIPVEKYNEECRINVMKYTEEWEELTNIMGFWLDMTDPYITYKNQYIESLWWGLKQLYDKGLLYKGYSIQPYSPSDGTGLSSHELNLPGCYKEVKDTSVTAMFEIIKDANAAHLFEGIDTNLYFLAWTTTPWTLPSNTALAVGKDITYVLIKTFNPYSLEKITIICAKDLYPTYFTEKNRVDDISRAKIEKHSLPYELFREVKGSTFEEVRYRQLLPYRQPETGDAFKVLIGDFVTTAEGTGIVHIAPSFGADDFRLAQKHNIGALTLVDKKGKFIEGTGELSGRYVKNEYDDTLSENDETVDVFIAILLKSQGKAFKIEKYVHPYPHSWRTDKPILFYPLDSWFIKTTAVKDKLIKLNRTINWKPKKTGTGRFEKWLENLVDWNLSRSRYWGTPLPIWTTEDKKEQKCIGSIGELKQEIEQSVKAGFMGTNPLNDFDENSTDESNYQSFDLHKPYIDDIILRSKGGKKMFREPGLIDVWFDSGAMPYAQQHFPFRKEADLPPAFPADFVAEGVDQTRGWFFTLHVLAVMLFDKVAFKNIISNGLVLDAKGNKMSKRLGNAVDPFKAIETHGADAIRWYMMVNSPPWDNLKFDFKGVEEGKRKFFGTLFNTYNFFTLYANIDGFEHSDKTIPYHQRPELDKWILSTLHSLVLGVTEAYENYDPTTAGRLIQYFTVESLSNWYVRLNRKRFWGGGYNDNKIAAYQTLFNCLETLAILASPIAPFYMDKLYRDLHPNSNFSVHLTYFPKADKELIDRDLEKKMALAQKITSIVLGLRRKKQIKVRQPLQKIIIPILSLKLKKNIEAVKDIILGEVNVKKIEYIDDTSHFIKKKIIPKFKKLGPKFGKNMRQIIQQINALSQQKIAQFEKNGALSLKLSGQPIKLSPEDVTIVSEDVPGYLAETKGDLTVALDIYITKELKQEGLARELVNRIQNLRKSKNFEVTDKIKIVMQRNEQIKETLENFNTYILSQTLATDLTLTEDTPNGFSSMEIDTDLTLKILIQKK